MNRLQHGALLRIAILFLILTGLPRAAAAEWHLTPLFGFTFKGSTTLQNDQAVSDDGLTPVSAVSRVHWNFGGSVVLIGSWPIGVEALVLYTPGFLQQESSVSLLQTSRTTALMGNLVLATPRRWNEYGLRPFVSGGFGLLRVSAEDPPANLWEKPVNLLGYNVGGGAIGFITNRTGVRFDLRYFSHVRPGKELVGLSFGPVELSYWNAAIGIVFRY